MKRLFVVPVLIAALAVPAAATALDTSAQTGAEAKGSPFSVSFTVVTQGGDPVAIREFKFKNLPMDCDQGLVPLTAKGFGQMPVSDAGRFNQAFNNGRGGDITVRGRFVNPSKVKGKITAAGTFDNGSDPDFTNCAGERKYTAQ